MKRPKQYQTGYPVAVKKTEDAEIFQMRDSVAYSELIVPLHILGYTYDSPLCLYPFRGEDSTDVKLDSPEHFKFLNRHDALVMTTRPPLDDLEAGKKKHIPPSMSHLEVAIFDGLRPYLSHCCRTRVELNQNLVRAVAKAQGVRVSESIAGFELKQNLDARLASTILMDGTVRKETFPDNVYSSIGIFINLPEIPHYGCRFVASFGFGGNETLAWNRIVGKQHPEWLATPCVVVARMNKLVVTNCPITMHHADQVEVEILLQHEITGPLPEGPEPSKQKSKSASTPASTANKKSTVADAVEKAKKLVDTAGKAKALAKHAHLPRRRATAKRISASRRRRQGTAGKRKPASPASNKTSPTRSSGPTPA